MGNMRNICIAVLVMLACAVLAHPASAQDGFISGMDGGFTFSVKQCGSAGKSTSFSSCGKTFKVITFYYGNSTVTAIEDGSGRRNILFKDGKPNMPTSSGISYPRIGFDGDKEIQTTEYNIGPHDFTDDGQSELVIGVRSASGDGMAVYVFGYISGAWRCMGEMVTSGRGISSCRVFRQTVTLKDSASGVLYTWTCHGGHFDFLSSDHVNNPTVLY